MDPYLPFTPIVGSQMLQPDGGPPSAPFYPPDLMSSSSGGGNSASLWGLPQCPDCAPPDERAAAACLPPDATRFYEGGPVVGGNGKRPVYGKDYVDKRTGAAYGQRYAGTFVCSPPAGKPSPFPAGRTVMDPPLRAGASEAVDLRCLMERLQQFIFRFRVRTKDFFKDFDPLNHGFVSANRFRRALATMGIGPGGRIALTEPEFDALLNFYRLEEDPSMVCWRKFDDDIESIFTQKGIEKMPLALTPSPERIAKLPNPGVTNMEEVPLRIRKLAKCAVARLKSRVEIEQCNIKYFFRGFDRIHNGHVSAQQFKQVLSGLNYHFTADELDAMAVLYCDYLGFNYLKLLDDIEPQSCEAGWYEKYKNGRLYQLNRPPAQPKEPENDLERIMYKIQARVVRRRPKLYNFFRDHDYLNHDRVKVIDFHRALDRAGFELTPREIEVLTCCFKSPEDPMEIEWRCFVNAVETVFTTPNLDKAPRVVPSPWKPLRDMDYCKEMNDEEYCKYVTGMRRLAQRVYQRRIEFRPMFGDFDVPQTGLVSKDQFHRVLHTVGLVSLVTQSELESIIKRFKVVRGMKDDVDYSAFIEHLDLITWYYPITPEEMSPTGVKWYKELNPCC